MLIEKLNFQYEGQYKNYGGLYRVQVVVHKWERINIVFKTIVVLIQFLGIGKGAQSVFGIEIKNHS